MQDLIILGTGVHSMEMVEIVERINNQNKTWNLLGYCSWYDEPEGKEANGYQIFKKEVLTNQYSDAFVVPDNTWPMDSGLDIERFVTIIDPSTFVSRTASIGKGCVIYPNCYIGLNVKLGNFIFCLSGSIINHDDIIGDYAKITSNVSIAGEVQIGEGCYLGQASTYRQLLKIGKNSTIGMGAVVVKDVPPDCIMVGNPAHKLRDK